MSRSRRGRGRLLVAAAALVLIAVIWAVTAWRSDPPTGAAAPVIDVGSVDIADLDRLSVQAAVPAGDPTYRRGLFGSAWQDVDGNGCNQRDDVLVRDAEPGTVQVQQQGACDHDVLGGTWVDPYTGLTVVVADAKANGQQIPIDHLVPLVEAYTSGARAWTEQRRVAFANDVANLRAVAQSTNQQKSGLDPAGWQPAINRCGYARAWIATKMRWTLAVDAAERTALASMLGRC